MGAIGEFFTSIGNFFKSIATVVSNVFEDIIYVLKLLYTSVSNIGTYFEWLPSAVAALLITGISVVVIYKVLGRD